MGASSSKQTNTSDTRISDTQQPNNVVMDRDPNTDVRVFDHDSN